MCLINKVFGNKTSIFGGAGFVFSGLQQFQPSHTVLSLIEFELSIPVSFSLHPCPQAFFGQLLLLSICSDQA